MTVSVIQSAPHHISVDGQKITYRTAGDPSNPPIVMVHGWLSHSRVWRLQMEQLQATHFCIAIDLLGFGDSDSQRSSDYSIEAQGRRVLAVADALNLDKFALMGHSMGGQIAIFIAAVLAPERITHLIDVSGVVSGALAWWPKYISKNQMWLGQVAPFLVPPTVWLFRVPWVSKVAFGSWFHIAPPFEVWAEDRERAMQPGTIPSGYPAVRAIMTTDTTAHLAKITCPALVIFGRHDRVVPPVEGERAAAGIPGARLRWFDDCGHFPQLEQPVAFNQAVTEFLS